MRSFVVGLVAALSIQSALGADLEVRPQEGGAGAGPCGGMGYTQVRLVEGEFHARTRTGRQEVVDQPNTVMTVCADGRVIYSQTAQSILPFTPEIAALPIPPAYIMAAAVAAAAVAVGVIAGTRQEDRPVSP